AGEELGAVLGRRERQASDAVPSGQKIQWLGVEHLADVHAGHLSLVCFDHAGPASNPGARTGSVGRDSRATTRAYPAASRRERMSSNGSVPVPGSCRPGTSASCTLKTPSTARAIAASPSGSESAN